jgi:hypothetical protein
MLYQVTPILCTIERAEPDGLKQMEAETTAAAFAVFIACAWVRAEGRHAAGAIANYRGQNSPCHVRTRQNFFHLWP